MLCPKILAAILLLQSGVSFVSAVPAPAPAPAPAASTPAVPASTQPAFDEADKALEKYKVADGLKMTTWAAEPQVANPVALWMDDQGRAWVVETFRFDGGGDGVGVYDIRNRYELLDEDLASKTVEQRMETVKRWDKGDITKLGVWPDRLRLIEDRTGKGKADTSSVFAEIKDPASGVAAGILVRDHDVYFADIPDMWLMHEKEGKLVDQKSLSTGYGVHYSLLGHDLHGLRMGPDGRLYFSMGDRGLHVKTMEGNIIDVPDCGAVLRCEPDGTKLELFATGLRNPQKLVFDQWGNLFTGDNNADYGDPARWVYIVEGGDTGWRIGYQHIRTPRPGGPWLQEKLTDTEAPGGAAYRLPPIAHIAAGPSGCTYYPGTGFGAKFKDHFFLTDFRAGPSSLTHSFALKPKGASFEMVDRGALMEHMVATDIEFGPDSAAYVTDWNSSFTKSGKGRIYRIFSPELDKSAEVLAVKKLLNEGMKARTEAELLGLLAHQDMRVRQGAQFELASRGQEPALLDLAFKSTNRLARIHAIWALGQIGRKTGTTSKRLVELLTDSDEEVRAQAANLVGEARIPEAYEALRPLLEDKSARVQFFAAIAIGKFKRPDAVAPLVKLLTENDNKDAFLRHAAALGLSEIGDVPSLMEQSKNASAAVRMGLVLALRKMEKPEVADFLHDSDVNVVMEAARAINDVPIEAARPQLAELARNLSLPEVVLHRALNANFRLGTLENAITVANLAAIDEAPEVMRIEAMQMLNQWAKPRGIDRVVGVWWPVPERDASIASTAARPIIKKLLTTGPEKLRLEAIELVKKIGHPESEILFDVATSKDTSETVAAAALDGLKEVKSPKLDEAIEKAMKSPSGALRIKAIGILAGREDAVARLDQILDAGSIADQQAVFDGLEQVQNPAAEQIIAKWMDKLIAGNVAPEVRLDVLDAAGKAKADAIKEKIKQYDAKRPKDDTLASYLEALAGGNAEAGRKIFFERQTVSCIRCHKIGNDGGVAGPNLSDVGVRKDRRYLLESIVDPNKQIAPGFEAVTVKVKAGKSYTGVVRADSDTEIVLDTGDGATVHIIKSEIEKRTKGLSPMPQDISKSLSKRDLRDVVEFLSGLNPAATAHNENLDWWRDARFGMFIHWGPVSMKGGDLSWSRGGKGGIWAGNIPVEEYDNLYKQFNPTKFDARQWVKNAQDAGMKYLVFTTRHHDGFAEFDSKLTDYKITNTPFARDVTKELADACHEMGMHFGIYYSPPDWKNPDFESADPAARARYIQYVHGQVRELCTNYGKVDIFWFDGSRQVDQRWDGPGLVKLVRELLPHAIINNRGGDAGGDFGTPEGDIGDFNTARAWESCICLTEQWGYKPEDPMKTLKRCIDMVVGCAGRDGNLLLNVPPTGTGEMEPRQVERLNQIGAWMKKYGDTIYGTRGGPCLPEPWGVCTQKGDRVFVHVLANQGGSMMIKGLKGKIASAKVLTGGEARFEDKGDAWKLRLVKGDWDDLDTIIELTITPATTQPAATASR